MSCPDRVVIINEFCLGYSVQFIGLKYTVIYYLEKHKSTEMMIKMRGDESAHSEMFYRGLGYCKGR